MAQTHPFDAELQDLWSRRATLDDKGWTRLYVIVTSILNYYRPKELAGLKKDREVYVQEFFIEKVFRRDQLSRCYHVGALRFFYQNYLLDQIKLEKSRSKWELEDASDPDSDSPPSLEEAPETANDAIEVIHELEEAGFVLSKITKAARFFLHSNEEWVRLFVALSNCPDAELSEPLVHLAKRKGIKSQAYKAKILGFNWRGTDVSEFRSTMIGQWITESVGIEIQPENIHLIHGALKILCFEALSWAEEQEFAP